MAKKIVAEIKNLSLEFENKITKHKNKVIRNTDLTLYEGEILGLIGESGSGKSVITSLLNGIHGDGRITSGTIKIFDTEVTNWTPKEWVKSNFRGKRIGRIFQNPMSALNPTLKIKLQLIESLLDFKIFKNEDECIDEVIKLLDEMDIKDPKKVLNLYPHELSGGMIQRIVIAMILALRPEIIIFDEPTTALDPVVQADILNIIKNINKKYNTSIIFITHDIGVIAAISDHINVMYAGRIIETGTKNEVLYNPQHPYTWGLLSSLPSSAINGKMTGIPGTLDLSLLKDNQDGFVFRNNYALDIDLEVRPPMFKVNNNHYAATWLLHKRAPKVIKPPFIVKLNKMYKGRR